MEGPPPTHFRPGSLGTWPSASAKPHPQRCTHQAAVKIRLQVSPPPQAPPVSRRLPVWLGRWERLGTWAGVCARAAGFSIPQEQQIIGWPELLLGESARNPGRRCFWAERAAERLWTSARPARGGRQAKTQQVGGGPVAASPSFLAEREARNKQASELNKLLARGEAPGSPGKSRHRALQQASFIEPGPFVWETTAGRWTWLSSVSGSWNARERSVEGVFFFLG